MPAGLLLWGASSSGGPSYANVLPIGYPLYDVVTDREPRSGSEFLQMPSGTEDAWVTGTDYVMTAEARWIDDSPAALPARAPVGGAGGWQSFLDYARSGAPFRFVPDASLPDFYVDGCRLVEPMRDAGKNAPNLQRNIDLKFRNPSVDFIRALRGVIFEYAPGRGLGDATYTRASLATYFDAAGAMRDAPSGVIRDKHYVGGVRTTLLERGTTNLVENGDVESDAVGFSVSVGATLSRVAANPRHGSYALSVTTTAAAYSGVGVTPRAGGRFAATAGTVYTFSVWVYADAAAAGKELSVNIDWWDAGAQIGNVYSGTYTLVLGWQRLWVTGTAPAGTVSCVAYCRPTTNQGVYTFWGDAFQLEASAAPTSFIPTNTGSAARAADALQFAWPWAARTPLWVYIDTYDLGTLAALAANAIGGWVDIGGTSAPHLFIVQETGPNVSLFQRQVAGDVYSRCTAASLGGVAYGDRLQMLARLWADGTIDFKVAKNGGAAVSGAGAGVQTLAYLWQAQTLIINAYSGQRGLNAFRVLKVGTGTAVDTIAKAAAY